MALVNEEILKEKKSPLKLLDRFSIHFTETFLE